jgi:HsdM N-terminal domain
MAIKKFELYSSLWASCDELRGGMDASQYKDYVLVLLFVKYVSDRYAGQPYAPIAIPPGASFTDMVALKGKTDIGDQINKKILGPLQKANNSILRCHRSGRVVSDTRVSPGSKGRALPFRGSKVSNFRLVCRVFQDILAGGD